jgi:hypothetical protein
MRLKRVGIDGTHLLVADLLREDAIPLGEIESVTQVRWLDPRPVIVTFRRETDFGLKVRFAPRKKHRLKVWKEDAVVEVLRQAVAETRAANARSL